MVDITLCYSILEYCFDNLNVYQKDNPAMQILEIINQHRINFCLELGEQYREYFENKRPDLIDQYECFIDNKVIYGESLNMINNIKSYNEIETITQDDYKKLILNICYDSEDKIISSEICSNIIRQLESLNICCVDSKRILDVNDLNLLRKYTLPIVAMKIKPGLPSEVISEWISRFLISESEFVIIDGYIYQNSESFYKYFLRYVRYDAKIKIYTILDRITESDILDRFQNTPKFKKWKFEIYIIKSKKEQHARNIFTNNYCIHLEKGMAVFGHKGKTDQSDITIQFKKNVADYEISECKHIC